MRSLNRLLLTALVVLPLFGPAPCSAQNTNGNTQGKPAASPEADVREKNIQEYIDLLRADVRQQKAQIMGALMVLSAADAAKFWPIYEQYDAELHKLNDQRVANVKEYAGAYTGLTDQKANELIQNAFAYQRQRTELVSKTYDRVKQALGAVTAGRFVQIEHQLLLLIDLQIASSLPLAGEGS